MPSAYPSDGSSDEESLKQRGSESQRPVRLTPKLKLLIAEHRCRLRCLVLANAGSFRRFLSADAALAGSQKDHLHFMALFHMLPQRAAATDGFVIGMRADYKDALHLVAVHLHNALGE